ncbi:hypothetical protein OQA88_3096 [Cercophora sp. LCS_1]
MLLAVEKIGAALEKIGEKMAAEVKEAGGPHRADWASAICAILTTAMTAGTNILVLAVVYRRRRRRAALDTPKDGPPQRENEEQEEAPEENEPPHDNSTTSGAQDGTNAGRVRRRVASGQAETQPV